MQNFVNFLNSESMKALGFTPSYEAVKPQSINYNEVESLVQEIRQLYRRATAVRNGRLRRGQKTRTAGQRKALATAYMTEAVKRQALLERMGVTFGEAKRMVNAVHEEFYSTKHWAQTEVKALTVSEASRLANKIEDDFCRTEYTDNPYTDPEIELEYLFGGEGIEPDIRVAHLPERVRRNIRLNAMGSGHALWNMWPTPLMRNTYQWK